MVKEKERDKAATRLRELTIPVAQVERDIEDIGYEVPWSRIKLLVLGMMGTHCEEAIKTALGTLPGIVSVGVNLGTDTVTVEFVEALVAAGTLQKTIREIGRGSGRGRGEI